MDLIQPTRFHVTAPDFTRAPAFADPDQIGQLAHARAEGDVFALADLLNDPTTLVISPRATVQVVEDALTSVRVALTDQQGQVRSGWIPAAWLRPAA